MQIMEWIRQNSDILQCLIAGLIPAVLAGLGLRFALISRVTRIDEHVKHLEAEHQRRLDQLQKQLDSLFAQPLSNPQVEKLRRSMREVKRLLKDDLMSHKEETRKMPPSGTQGQTQPPVPIKEMPNLQDSKSKKKRPKRKKKADTDHQKQV